MIRCYLINSEAKVPSKAHDDDAGFDLYTPEPFILSAGESKDILLGISLEIPRGFFGMIAGRSSLNRVDIHAYQGVIDSGYRGDVTVRLRNLGNSLKIFSHGDRIAQLLVMPLGQVFMLAGQVQADSLKIVQAFVPLPDSERGDKGFGSTGA